MTSHAEWFREMHNLERLGSVEIRDYTTHPISHIGKMPLSMQDGKTKFMGDVLHIPNITKNLICVTQMVG